MAAILQCVTTHTYNLRRCGVKSAAGKVLGVDHVYAGGRAIVLLLVLCVPAQTWLVKGAAQYTMCTHWW